MARALRSQCRSHRFDSGILHEEGMGVGVSVGVSMGVGMGVGMGVMGKLGKNMIIANSYFFTSLINI